MSEYEHIHQLKTQDRYGFLLILIVETQFFQSVSLLQAQNCGQAPNGSRWPFSQCRMFGKDAKLG
jgi:hypothetical protein